jgi:hypothetical protein
MQRIPVAFIVIEQEGRGFRLTGRVTTLQIFLVRLGIPHVDLHRLVPPIGHRGERAAILAREDRFDDGAAKAIQVPCGRFAINVSKACDCVRDVHSLHINGHQLTFELLAFLCPPRSSPLNRT